MSSSFWYSWGAWCSHWSGIGPFRAIFEVLVHFGPFLQESSPDDNGNRFTRSKSCPDNTLMVLGHVEWMLDRTGAGKGFVCLFFSEAL